MKDCVYAQARFNEASYCFFKEHIELQCPLLLSLGQAVLPHKLPVHRRDPTFKKVGKLKGEARKGVHTARYPLTFTQNTIKLLLPLSDSCHTSNTNFHLNKLTRIKITICFILLLQIPYRQCTSILDYCISVKELLTKISPQNPFLKEKALKNVLFISTFRKLWSADHLWSWRSAPMVLHGRCIYICM